VDEYAILVLEAAKRPAVRQRDGSLRWISDPDLDVGYASYEDAIEAHYRGDAPYPGPPGAFRGTASRQDSDGGHVERRSCWSATLTTRRATDVEMAVTAASRIEPPPAFVAATLNAVATEGWTVHHVGEDRAVEGDKVRLVSVRYLLRRVIS
jgi:hypothetical protein